MSSKRTAFLPRMRRTKVNEKFYKSFKDEYLARKNRLLSLIEKESKKRALPPKIKGDYYEALIREFVRKNISKKFRVGHGLVYDETKDLASRECDIIVFQRTAKPLFESQDLVIVDPYTVKFVMEIKSQLNTDTMRSAIGTLESVKQIDNKIMCWIIGFQNKNLLKTLYLNAWKRGKKESFLTVQFLHVLEPRKFRGESEELMERQMEFFIRNLNYYGEAERYPTSGSASDFVLYLNNRTNKMILLKWDSTEDEIAHILYEIYTKGIESVAS